MKLRKQLEALRDEHMTGDCNYSKATSKALQLIMDAIDELTPRGKKK